MSTKDEIKNAIVELDVSSKAVMNELRDFVKSMNELEQTEVSAFVDGWKVSAKKIEDIQEHQQ